MIAVPEVTGAGEVNPTREAHGPTSAPFLFAVFGLPCLFARSYAGQKVRQSGAGVRVFLCRVFEVFGVKEKGAGRGVFGVGQPFQKFG